MLFVINSQLGRRNIADIDRIMLVSKREEILRRQAKANQSAAGKQTSLGKRFADVVLALAPKAASLKPNLLLKRTPSCGGERTGRYRSCRPIEVDLTLRCRRLRHCD